MRAETRKWVSEPPNVLKISTGVAQGLLLKLEARGEELERNEGGKEWSCYVISLNQGFSTHGA